MKGMTKLDPEFYLFTYDVCFLLAFVLQNSLPCVFSETTAWGILSTTVHKTDAILVDSKESSVW